MYEAIDREYQSRVAIKTLQRLEGNAILRFKNEFRMLQGLHHRNLVRLGELFESEGQWFFTMELLRGVDFMTYVAPKAALPGADGVPDRPKPPPSPVLNSLDEVTRTSNKILTQVVRNPSKPKLPIRASVDIIDPDAAPRNHRFDEERLREALRQLAMGLDVLHQAGKVHRDIKPHNVMVTQDDRIVLLDFGLVSEHTGKNSLEHGMVLGTPAYMAPEQAAGEPITPASDFYGVGVMLYEAMVGIRPFVGDPGQIMLSKQTMDPNPPSRLSEHIPTDLEELCMRMLSRDPVQRPLGRDLLRALRTEQDSVAWPRALPRGHSEFTRIGVPLIGRESLLDELHATFSRRSHGRPQAVFVHGSSGMGKTALIDQFAQSLEQRRSPSDTLVMRGRCYERESVPYKAFDGIVDALARFLKQPDIGAEFLIPLRIDILIRLFPVLDGMRRPYGLPEPVGQAKDPQAQRREAFVALKEMLTRVAAKWPLVIIIDDLQWGDLDSAALLTEIMSPPSAPSMMLIASYRSEEADSPLVASLREKIGRAMPKGTLSELQVGPLSRADCQRLARASLASWDEQPTLPESEREDPAHTDVARISLVDAIVRESDGSPFFVAELARHLAAEQTDRDPAGLTFKQMMSTRRRRLETDARTVLDIIAVAGQPIAQGIVLHAAGLPISRDDVFSALRAEHLIRTRGPGTRDPAECYHDRIREAVASLLKPDALRDVHRSLALAFETDEQTRGVDNAEMLAECYLGADDLERAAKYALLAADNAERALAFGRAADMLRIALDIQPGSADQERALRIRLGDALANADRGDEAAAEFLAIAQTAPDDLATDLRRRAAQQLLTCGRIDEGLALLGEVLTTNKLHIPRTDHGALMSLAMNRARLRLRGLHYTPKPVDEIAERDRRRIDVCWTGAVGLGMADPIRGADFGTRCLLMALKSGDEVRIARTLAVEAALLPSMGDKGVKRAETLADMAAEIARRIDDPQGLGLAVFGLGCAAFFSGRWRTAYEQCERAESIIREGCTGIAWEMTTLRFFRLASLYYLGEWSAMHEGAAVAVRHALERDDRYMVASLVSYATFSRLAADDVDGARMTIREATVKWSLHGYHIQHYVNLMAHLFTDLYEGEGAKSWNRLQQEWPQLNRSLLKRVQLVRIEMFHGRARCALSHIAHSSSLTNEQTESLLKTAISDAKRLDKERVEWATPLAGLVRAAVSAHRGDIEVAISILKSATQSLDQADMNLFAAAARWRMGELIGGNRGDASIRQADESMRAQGIVNPRRIVDTLAPGFS